MYVKGFYPVILLPDLLIRYCQFKPLPVLEGVQAVAHVPPSPPVKPNIYKPRYSLTFRYWALGFIILLVINWSLGFYLFNFLLAIAFSLLIVFSFLAYDYLLVQQLKDDYQQKLADYHRKLADYSVFRAMILNGRTGEKNKDQTLISERQQQLKRLLKNSILLPNTCESNACEGASEKLFSVYLYRYFPDTFQGGVFPIPNSNLSYTADFRVYHKATGLFIQVEIDEPYVLSTGKPHHCIDDDGDERRNQFFLKGNWVIIRFAEQQIVTQPESCCKQIAMVIYQITGDSSFLDKLKSFPNVKLHKQWKFKEAKMMAKNNYRGTYLNIEVPVNVTNIKFRNKKDTKRKGRY